MVLPSGLVVVGSVGLEEGESLVPDDEPHATTRTEVRAMKRR